MSAMRILSVTGSVTLVKVAPSLDTKISLLLSATIHIILSTLSYAIQ